MTERMSAHDVIVAVPGGRGYEDRVEAAVQAALNEAFVAGARAARDAAVQAFDDADRNGRDWVPGSLWDALCREGVARIKTATRPVCDATGEGR